MTTTRTLTYPELTRKLIDLRALAIPAQPAESSGAFTSRDRASRYDPETGHYVDWDANNDGSGYIRQEGDSIVAFEADGPGVIWRIWSALPKNGHIRIYIDHSPSPVVDMPFQDFYQDYNGQFCPANFPNLTPTLSRGRNRFLPIAYQKHCKICLDKEWGMYYHMTYTTYPQGYTVPSFGGSYDNATGMALAEVDRAIALRGTGKPTAGAQRIMLTLQPGETVEAFRFSGHGAIRAFRVHPEFDVPGEAAAALRELTLSMTWDGDAEPAVWAPLGDFFGTAPGIQPYRALPLGMDWHGMYCQWYMPFEYGASITFTNDGTKPRVLHAEVDLEDAPDAGQMLRFHAKWHRNEYKDLDTARFLPGGDRWPDWPLLLVKGSGRFCGVHLHVYDAWREPQTKAEEWWYGIGDKKSIDWWWGEGDEKFFVDGETMPSTFGTGSEDYVGYAWAAEPPFPLFDSAFACQPFSDDGGNGHTCVNRFHIADNIPFQQRFEGFIEKYLGDQWGEGNKCLYAATAYFYLSPGQQDGYREVPVNQRRGVYHLD